MLKWDGVEQELQEELAKFADSLVRSIKTENAPDGEVATNLKKFLSSYNFTAKFNSTNLKGHPKLLSKNTVEEVLGLLDDLRNKVNNVLEETKSRKRWQIPEFHDDDVEYMRKNYIVLDVAFASLQYVEVTQVQ